MIVGTSTPLLPVGNAKFFSNVNDEQLDHVYIILKVFSEVCNKWQQQLSNLPLKEKIINISEPWFNLFTSCCLLSWASGKLGSVVDQCMIVGTSTPLLPVGNAKFFSNVNDEQLDHVYIILKVCNKWHQRLWRRKLKDWEVSKVKNKKHWNSSFARTYRVYH